MWLLVVYAFLLRWLELGERRCAYCGALLGWKWFGAVAARPQSLSGKALPFVVSHGICPPCNRSTFGEGAA